MPETIALAADRVDVAARAGGLARFFTAKSLGRLRARRVGKLG
jgi:hypothetical protein